MKFWHNPIFFHFYGSAWNPRQTQIPIKIQTWGQKKSLKNMSAVLEVMSVRNSAGTDRSPSRPAALLGTVALGVRLAEHWVSKITPKEKRGMGTEVCRTWYNVRKTLQQDSRYAIL